MKLMHWDNFQEKNGGKFLLGKLFQFPWMSGVSWGHHVWQSCIKVLLVLTLHNCGCFPLCLLFLLFGILVVCWGCDYLLKEKAFVRLSSQLHSWAETFPDYTSHYVSLPPKWQAYTYYHHTAHSLHIFTKPYN